MSWFESESFCKAQGAELASCLSGSEAHFISSMTKSQKDKEFWIGINRLLVMKICSGWRDDLGFFSDSGPLKTLSTLMSRQPQPSTGRTDTQVSLPKINVSTCTTVCGKIRPAPTQCIQFARRGPRHAPTRVSSIGHHQCKNVSNQKCWLQRWQT